MAEDLLVKADKTPVRTSPTVREYLGFVLSILLWIGGGVALAYGLSLWESATHQDAPELAHVRLIGDLVIGGVVGFAMRLARFAKNGR